MRRNTFLLLVGAVAVFAAGCRDAILEPNRANSFSASASPLLSRNSANHDRTLIATLDLSPKGGTYHVGDFDVVIPAGAVCDPRTTKYGARHWDADCRPARRSITVNVVAETRHGQVSVDFQPDLRFRPSAGWVRIETHAYSDLLTSDAARQLSPGASYFNQFAILYVPTGRTSRIDEVRSSGDASMVTHVELGTGLVWRRVKHFSGYMVSLGDKCTPTPDDACPTDPNATTLTSSSNLTTTTESVSASSVVVTP
jgi:hypothetical protein